MRKWAFLCAAAAIVAIGCQGGGGGGTTTTGGTTTGGDSTAFVTMPASPGLINVTYITGQGRAPGSPIAVMRRVYFIDQFNDQPDDDPLLNAETKLNPEIYLGLDQYTLQTIGVNAVIPAVVENRKFDTFYLEVARLRVENGQGGYDDYDNGGQPAVNEQFALQSTVLRGRQTTLPVFLDDSMLYYDGNIVFNRSQFELINYDPDLQTMIAFIGDYMEFDVSLMAAVDRPTMSSGAPAGRVYFSGDNEAVSESGDSGVFEALTPTGYIEGSFNAPRPPIDTGTYTLVQADPRDLTGQAKITSLLGIWRDYKSVIGGLGTFEFFALPSSRDDSVQDLVMIHRNGGGQIDNLFFGVLDYAAGTWSAWPIANLDDGSIGNEITGTVSGYVDVNGGSIGNEYPKIRAGRFTIDPGAGVPGNFPASGRFIVFRR